MNIKRKGARRIIFYFIIFVGLVGVLFPLVVSVSISFQSPNEVLKYPPTLIPQHPTFGNYKMLLASRNFLRYIWNTIFVATITTLITLSTGSLAAYALAHYKFFGSKLLSQSILLVYMFPPALLIIPLYLIMSKWNLIDTRVSLIIAYITFSLPMCIWLLKGFFDGLPKDIEDAARIDGCGELGILIRIVIPLSAPGLMAAGAFSYMLVWTEYMYAVTFVTSGAKLTLTAGIASIIGQYFANYGIVMAGCILGIIPAMIFFFGAQRLVISGLVSGAVKG